MISYDDALKIIRREGQKRLLAEEHVSLEHIVNRIGTQDIKAPIAVQPFDNSAMDGFALRAENIAAAGNDNPVPLNIAGKIAAGDRPFSQPLSQGDCLEIMTGAPLPPGCDTIVPVEDTIKKNKTVLFNKPAATGDHIRLAGEDFKAGAPVLSPGDILNEQHVLLLATLGLGTIPVYCKPKVGYVSTGREIVDDLNDNLEPGQIYNSTGPYLKAMLPALGADTHSYGSIPDDETSFARAVNKMRDDGMDLIVSTGAVSAGAHDFVRKALEDMGAEILFHKVKVRPGKPILCARFPDNGPLFFGLPGNPVATATGLRFFVSPCLQTMRGQPMEASLKARLTHDYTKRKADFRFFMKAVTKNTGAATTEIEILDGQQSFMVHPLLTANSWAVLPEEETQLTAGDIIEFYPLLPLFH